MIFKILRKVFGNDLIAGIFFIIISFLSFILPFEYYDKTSSLVVGASYYLGVMLVGNYITLKLGGFSIIHNVLRSSKERRSFLTISCAIGIIFGFITADLGGLWYFPYWSIFDYVIIGFVLGGWAFYILSMIVCYEAGKLILDKLFSFRPITRYFSFENIIYPSLLVIGLLLWGIVLEASLTGTQYFTKFQFILNASKEPYLTWPYWIAAFFAAIFVCEFIEYKRKRTSLLKDTLHGYWSPILSLVLVSLFLAITNEVQNLAVYLWRYANYPWANTNIFNVPLFVIVTWPMSVIFFIEMWRAFGTNTSKIMFANDRIK